MSTDPTTWPKPQALIRARAEQHSDTNDQTGASALNHMAADLDRYEADQGMTYVAVPTIALKRLRNLWGSGSGAPMDSYVRDVFGGIDGHLIRIDHALEGDQTPADDEDGFDLPTDMGRGLQRSMLRREAEASVRMDREGDGQTFVVGD